MATAARLAKQRGLQSGKNDGQAGVMTSAAEGPGLEDAAATGAAATAAKHGSNGHSTRKRRSARHKKSAGQGGQEPGPVTSSDSFDLDLQQQQAAAQEASPVLPPRGFLSTLGRAAQKSRARLLHGCSDWADRPAASDSSQSAQAAVPAVEAGGAAAHQVRGPLPSSAGDEARKKSSDHAHLPVWVQRVGLLDAVRCVGWMRRWRRSARPWRCSPPCPTPAPARPRPPTMRPEAAPADTGPTVGLDAFDDPIQARWSLDG